MGMDIIGLLKKLAGMEYPGDIPGQQKFFAHDLPAARQLLAFAITYELSQSEIDCLADELDGLRTKD